MQITWRIIGSIDVILPVPPSKKRTFQPVIEIAEGISSALKIPLFKDFLRKTKETPELKNVYEYHKRLELLKDTFIVKDLSLKGKNVLLFDDLYRSGATINEITRVLQEKGMVSKVYVLAITKTRSRS
jgi:predicted amidophosphoribosyltransferase